MSILYLHSLELLGFIKANLDILYFVRYKMTSRNSYTLPQQGRLHRRFLTKPV